MSDETPKISPEQVYELVGSQGFEQLVDAFYRYVEVDDVLRPLYPPGDLAPAARRLRLFLEQYFGGPETYSIERGHPRLRARHIRYPIDQVARDRWVDFMNAALDEVGFDDEISAIMREYFATAATFLMNTPPDVGGMFSIQ